MRSATHPSRTHVERRLPALLSGVFLVLGAVLPAVVAVLPAGAAVFSSGTGSVSGAADPARDAAQTELPTTQPLVLLAGPRAQASAATPSPVDDSGFTLPMPVVGTARVQLGLRVLVQEIHHSRDDVFSSVRASARHDRAPPTGGVQAA